MSLVQLFKAKQKAVIEDILDQGVKIGKNLTPVFITPVDTGNLKNSCRKKTNQITWGGIQSKGDDGSSLFVDYADDVAYRKPYPTWTTFELLRYIQNKYK